MRKEHFVYAQIPRKKTGSFPAFWAYSRYKKEIHPVIRGFCGYERSVVTVYAQSGKRGKGNKKTS